MPIPHIFFQTSRNKPEQYIVDKILSKCHDWKYVHYSDEEAIEFMKLNYIEEFKDIIDKFNTIKRGEHKADLFRYYHLYITGGVFMDSDAMIETDIDDVIKDYDFFTVASTYAPGAIFQGFIGSTPGNVIIYEALKHAYSINIDELSKNYFVLCFYLNTIVENHKNNFRVYLYSERFYRNDCAEVFDTATNKTIVLHYWEHKIIPRTDIGTYVFYNATTNECIHGDYI